MDGSRRKRVGSLRTLRRAAAFIAIVAAVSVVGAPGAFATTITVIQNGWDQDHIQHGSGAHAYIEVSALSPQSNACLLYSDRVEGSPDDNSVTAQLEAGIVKCNGTSIDGSCGNNKYAAFFEFFTSDTGYWCYEMQTWTTPYHDELFHMRRDDSTCSESSNGPNLYYLTYNSQAEGGFCGFPGGYAWAGAWGEYTTGGFQPTCGSSWTGDGFFSSLQWYDGSSGWAYPVGGNSYRYNYPSSCFDVSTVVSGSLTISKD